MSCFCLGGGGWQVENAENAKTCLTTALSRGWHCLRFYLSSTNCFPTHIGHILHFRHDEWPCKAICDFIAHNLNRSDEVALHVCRNDCHWILFIDLDDDVHSLFLYTSRFRRVHHTKFISILCALWICSICAQYINHLAHMYIKATEHECYLICFYLCAFSCNFLWVEPRAVEIISLVFFSAEFFVWNSLSSYMPFICLRCTWAKKHIFVEIQCTFPLVNCAIEMERIG